MGKLVAAIRQIAELEEKVEQCEKKSKELSADVERRGRQTFYLDRNLETREREIQELNRQMYTLEGKADPEDFEALRDDQDMTISRLQRKAEQLKGDLAKKQAEEKSSKDEAKQLAADLSKANSASQEIISMSWRSLKRLPRSGQGIRWRRHRHRVSSSMRALSLTSRRSMCGILSNTAQTPSSGSLGSRLIARFLRRRLSLNKASISWHHRLVCERSTTVHMHISALVPDCP